MAGLLAVSVSITTASVYFLYVRFSSYIDPHWGAIYDRGEAGFWEYFICLVTYAPALVCFFLPPKAISRALLVVCFLIYFLSALFIDLSVLFLSLDDDTDEVYLVSMVVRGSISIFIGLYLAIVVVIRFFK